MLVLDYTNTPITIATYTCYILFTQSLVYHTLSNAPRAEFAGTASLACALRVGLMTLDSNAAKTYFAARF
jgi:hypothetical protein